MTDDDFVGIDHRRLAASPSGGRELWLELIDERYSRSFEIIVDHVPVLTEKGGVFACTTRLSDGTGEWEEVVVQLVENGRHARNEWYDFDQLDAAIARFEALTAG